MTSILKQFRNLRSLLKIKVREKRAFKVRFMFHATHTRPALFTPAKRQTISSSRCMSIARQSTVQVEKDENITLIGICREEYRNSIDLATSQALKEAIKNFEVDATSPVGVLYGFGGTFSAGHDVNELEQQIVQNNFNYLFQTEGSIAPTRRHLRKPLVCAINGFCVAGGLELALLCDLRVMEDTAAIGFFNRIIGVPICDGGTARLSEIIGYARAFDLIASGRRMSAKEAFEIGLINRIVATGTSLGQAVNLAFSISKFSQNALLHDRAGIYKNAFEFKTFEDSVREEALLTNEMLNELKMGVKKFRNSETKGAKVDSFNIKEKPLPDWEKGEIKIENEYAKNKLKCSKIV